MKLVTAILAGLFLTLGAQSVLATSGHYHTKMFMSEQEAITKVKKILPMIKNGTDKAAISVAQQACGNYTGSKVKLARPQAEIDEVWEESNGEYKKNYFAHITYDVQCSNAGNR